MKLFDEDGNYVGELLKDSIESVKDNATSALDDGSWILGLIGLLILFPGWSILCGIIYVIVKVVGWTFKIAINLLWWLIRLPFTLIFRREFPEF